MAIPYWAHILKGTRHFIFTQDADNLTKPKTEQKRDFISVAGFYS